MDITCTWPAPGHDLVTFPAAIEAVLEDVQLKQHEQIVGKRPRGYRSPAWDFTESTLEGIWWATLSEIYDAWTDE